MSRYSGVVAQTQEERRSARGMQWIEGCRQDVRYAARSFRKSPGFVLAVVATIALGLGLNTTFFTIFNAYVLRPLAVRDPYSLYKVAWTNHEGMRSGFAWPEFESLSRHNPACSELLGQRFLFARVESHPLQGELVTGNYF